MHAGITAAVGFLIVVLWFDLMFDVQVIGHRNSAEPPERLVDSMATYYRRVTTDASPMGRLISLVMAVLVALFVWQAVRDGTPGWVSVVSLMMTVLVVQLAGG